MSSSNLVTKRSAVGASNWRAGRAWPHAPDSITIHVTEGSAASVRSWFGANRPNDNPSAAHYMVTVAGGVELFVDEDDTAYHAGQLVEPSHPVVIARYAAGKYTPNSYAIGIEHEGDGLHELTDAQRRASVALIADICRRRGIPADRTHIFGHHEVKKTKPCPGAISVDRLVADVARELLGMPPALDTLGTHAASVPVLSPSLGWLVPVSVVSDTSWTFTTVDEIRAATMARRVCNTWDAGAPLSTLKTAAG